MADLSPSLFCLLTILLFTKTVTSLFFLQGHYLTNSLPSWVVPGQHGLAMVRHGDFRLMTLQQSLETGWNMQFHPVITMKCNRGRGISFQGGDGLCTPAL